MGGSGGGGGGWWGGGIDYVMALKAIYTIQFLPYDCHYVT